MNSEKLSGRQLAVAAFAGGLAPAAAGAGHGWQGALAAAPGLVLLGWVLVRLAPRWPRLMGTRRGKGFYCLLALWAGALLGRGLSRCAGRLTVTGGGDEAAGPGLVLLLAAAVMFAVWGRTAAFFRGAEICYLGIGLSAGTLLVWGAFHVRPEYLVRPPAGLGWGALAALESAGTFLFLLPQVSRLAQKPAQNGRIVPWLAALAAANVLLGAVTVGVLSPAVAGSAAEPLFLMTAVLGKTVRVEGLASALWLLSDVGYLGLLARSWQREGREENRLPCLAVGLGAAAALSGWLERVPEPIWGLGTGLIGLLAAALLWRAGENSGMAGQAETTSCGGEGEREKT